MTDHAPIDQPIVEILQAYNPLEIKDILLHGSWRKAVHHKETRYAFHNHTTITPTVHTTGVH